MGESVVEKDVTVHQGYRDQTVDSVCFLNYKQLPDTVYTSLTVYGMLNTHKVPSYLSLYVQLIFFILTISTIAKFTEFLFF